MKRPSRFVDINGAAADCLWAGRKVAQRDGGIDLFDDSPLEDVALRADGDDLAVERHASAETSSAHVTSAPLDRQLPGPLVSCQILRIAIQFTF
jgi:hypothetical protein